jgi:hypothetical protein
MTTYTAVLIANTAVPAWHDARHHLPVVFAAGSAASAGAVGILVGPYADSGPLRRLAVGGVAVTLVAEQLMERRLGYTAEPYRKGLSGWLMRGSKALGVAGATLLALRGRSSRAAGLSAAAALTVGEVLLRWGVFRAGDASSRDPAYTVRPQRERADRDGTRATITVTRH